jgi:heme-degrading monooxygenase HmoA
MPAVGLGFLQEGNPHIHSAGPEVPMYARVWKFIMLPGKVAEFAAATRDMMPVLRRQPGFCGCIVLRGGPEERLEATVVSAWESLVALRNSENNLFQEGLARIVGLCERHPIMREEEVLVSEFVARDLADTVTDF